MTLNTYDMIKPDLIMPSICMPNTLIYDELLAS